MRVEARRDVARLVVVVLLLALTASACLDGLLRRKVNVRRPGGGVHGGGGSGGFGGVEAPVIIAPVFSEANVSGSLMGAAKTLLQRLPDYDTELEPASRSGGEYRAVVQSYLEDPANLPALREALLEEHRIYLGLGGSRSDSDIAWDFPARLGTHLVLGNLDYRELLTAKYCLNERFEKVSCDAFKDQPAAVNEHGAGVLSSRAFVAKYKNAAAFNFKLVKAAFQLFACSAYPDAGDQGSRPSVVSSSFRPWGLQDGRPSECYMCHRSMNPKSYPFYFFNSAGYFTTKVNETTRRDTNAPSPQSDVIIPGQESGILVMGMPTRTLAQLGEVFAADPRFGRCMVRRYVNFMLGQPYDRELPKEAEFLVTSFKNSGYKVRELLLQILTSGFYVNREVGS